MSGGARQVRAPGQPRNVTVQVASKQATLSWLPPWDDGGSPVTSYVVAIIGSDAPTVTLPATQRSWTFLGLTDGLQYPLTVRASNEAGRGPAVTAMAVPMG